MKEGRIPLGQSILRQISIDLLRSPAPEKMRPLYGDRSTSSNESKRMVRSWACPPVILSYCYDILETKNMSSANYGVVVRA